jgi:hypothetical protein
MKVKPLDMPEPSLRLKRMGRLIKGYINRASGISPYMKGSDKVKTATASLSNFHDRNIMGRLWQSYSMNNMKAKLTDNAEVSSKYLYTDLWGPLKLRKNGALRFCVGDEIVRVQYKGSYFDRKE